MSTISYNLTDTSKPVIDTVNKILPKIPLAILVLIIGVLCIRLIRHFVRLGFSFTNLPKGLRDVITSLVDIALWVFLFIGFLQFVGLNNIAFAVTGSFAFVVLGLSQGGATAISDVIAGLTLSRDRDFKVGDYIKVGEKNTEGTIEEIDIRRTRLRDKDGRIHILPNALIDKQGWILVERGKRFQKPQSRLTIPVKRKVKK